MKTKEPSNQTPEQENKPEREESAATPVNEKQETDDSAENEKELQEIEDSTTEISVSPEIEELVEENTGSQLAAEVSEIESTLQVSGDENQEITSDEPEIKFQEEEDEITAVLTLQSEPEPATETKADPEQEPVLAEISEEVISTLEPEVSVSDEAVEQEIIKAVEDSPALVEEITQQEAPHITEAEPSETSIEEEVAENEVSEEQPIEENLKIAAIQDDATESEEDEEEEEGEEESEEVYQNLSRAELVDLMEATVQEPDVQAIKVKVALIKVAYLHKEKEEEQEQYDRFLKEGGVQEDYTPEPDQLSERFQVAFNVYKDKKVRYNEDLEKEKFQNLEAKKKILEDLKALINSEETLKKTYDEFKVLQDDWKQIGMVPKNEINQLWQNYHFLVEKFFDKVKINKELKDLDMKKNLERKVELCEKAEELLIETSIIKSFKQLQQYHEEWKEIGPVPPDKRDEIWERFKIASDQINERRREYYNKKQSELESNYLAKNALCEKAEKLIAHTPETLRQWQNRTSDINELLRVWKTIGLAPKKVNNEVWVRFKTCLDSHFTSYKEYLAKMKDYQLNNYNLKLDLCAQAEAIKSSTDWRNTTQELIKLQREWKSIGPVPRKHSDKIWKRFRTACDEFFKHKSDYFSNLAEVEDNNMKKKEEMIKNLEAFEFSDNRSQNLETLKDFQREWLEIGHVPIKEKDRLQNAFRNVLNKHFSKLKIDATEVSALHYRNRLESMRDMPDAGRVLNRERNALQIGISKLQEDIMLWENNIGFLAESKNANIVKVEFQKKIDQAKQEVALMEAKLRYIREI